MKKTLKQTDDDEVRRFERVFLLVSRARSWSHAADTNVFVNGMTDGRHDCDTAWAGCTRLNEDMGAGNVRCLMDEGKNEIDPFGGRR